MKQPYEILKEQMETLYNMAKQNSRARSDSLASLASSPTSRSGSAKQIDTILDKKIEEITAEETKILDNYITEAAGHDCDFDNQCAICWRAMKINKMLGKIYKFDEITENEIEQMLLTN